MVLTPFAAGWFLLAVIPLGVWATYTDLSRLKIPNYVTDGLALAYVVIGFFVLPFDVLLWGIGQFIIVLLAVFVLNILRLLSGGDGKFIAASAPYIAVSDLTLVLIIFSASLLAAFVTHRLVRASPLRKLVPNWASWTSGKRFPMGFPLSMTLITYLVIVWQNG